MSTENFSTPDIALAARLRSIALDAARLAAPVLRGAFRQDVARENKTNAHDLVTAFDRQSEEIIRGHLLAAEPDSLVLGEEGGSTGAGSIEWIVDPIDGTSNFTHGVAFFCISIAAARDGVLLAAVVLDPIADLEFTADAQHAYLNGTILAPGSRPDQKHANIMTDYPSAEALEVDGEAGLREFGAWVGAFATVRRKVSAAMALAHVAAGWCDATIGFDTKPWDVAAGALLVRRAGGTYLGFRYDVHTLPDHEAPCFLALGPGADYPVLDESIHRIIAARNARGSVGSA
ncbi:inositol monophosphatase family protein [Paeniglutamicibacter sulfureus]|uniref:inositol-phosphate phosphatase n=1 Tax=Paeniglutamicibacter sulfureus TaxID=43666 RepID=A0ABU2BGL4_9MICC|nr:inositol monophosphatase family protein [Paeniglutamicibacter sulfureus]MDR7357753.1 myo-inositol-1(or 4)-monophosphatase [Paeniglutamicibacter sulfureus]